MLIEISCKHCGAKDLREENGVYICPYCGSRYVFDRQDDVKARKIERLEDEMFEELEKDKYEECGITARKILVMNPHHAYAWAIIMMAEISKGIRSCNASKIVKAARNALEYADPEDWEDISGGVRNHINQYRSRLFQEDPKVADDLRVIDHILVTRETAPII